MNKKGVTLIELLVVMVIIAIGAALTTPNIGGWLTIYRLKSATRDVTSVLRLAQLKAVSGNTTYQVVFDTVNNNYIIQYLNTGGAYVAEGTTQVLPTGVTFNTDFGNVASFSPNSIVANSGDINFTNTKGMIKKIKLQSGRVKIE